MVHVAIMKPDPHGWRSLGFRRRDPKSPDEVHRAIIREARRIKSTHWMPWENLAGLHHRALRPFGVEVPQDPEHPVNQSLEEVRREAASSQSEPQVRWGDMTPKERRHTLFFGLLGFGLLFGAIAAVGMLLDYCMARWCPEGIGWAEFIGTVVVLYVMGRIFGR